LQKSTGTPDEFAKRLNISRNSFFRLLDSLREMDAEIGYDKKNTHLLLL
jgi:DNA-binding IclR family transcriptional regulator